MRKVSIYTYFSMHSPRPANGTGGYVLEFVGHDGPITRQQLTRIENVSIMQAELMLIISAFERLTAPCEVVIWQSGWIRRAVEEHWIDKWIVNDWKTAKGHPVNYQDKWQQLVDFISNHKCVFVDGRSQYTDWLSNNCARMD